MDEGEKWDQGLGIRRQGSQVSHSRLGCCREEASEADVVQICALGSGAIFPRRAFSGLHRARYACEKVQRVCHCRSLSSKSAYKLTMSLSYRLLLRDLPHIESISSSSSLIFAIIDGGQKYNKVFESDSFPILVSMYAMYLYLSTFRLRRETAQPGSQ